MYKPLMPKATAVWLIDNTALSFNQIAEFCNLHILEIQAIADGEVGAGIVGFDPINNSQISREELEKCENDHERKLQFLKSNLPEPKSNTKGPKYIPLSKRGDKPNGIAWLIKFHPELKDNQIVKLIGTTKNTILKIRDRSHSNINNINAKNPVLLELCNQEDLSKAIIKAGGDPNISESQPILSNEMPQL